MARSPGPTGPELKQALRQGPPQEVIVFEPTAHALGTGSYASVLPCQLLVSAQGESVPAAAKVLHPDAASRDSAAFKLFAREALVMAKLHHRNIVRCYGLVRLPANAANLPALQHARQHFQAAAHQSSKPKRPADEGLWCMLLEMADRGSMAKLLLKQMCQQFRSIYTNSQMLQWLTDIASALAFCHSQTPKVVHRDLKQENILLKGDPKSGADVAMLTDFGLHVRLERSRKPALRCASASLTGNQQLLLQEALASVHASSHDPHHSASASAAEASYMRRLSRASMNSDLFVSAAVARAHGMEIPPMEQSLQQHVRLSADAPSASPAPAWAPTLEGASNASLTVMLGAEEASQASQHYIIIEEEGSPGESGWAAGPPARGASTNGVQHAPCDGVPAMGHRTSSANGTTGTPRPSMLGDRRATKASPLSNQSPGPSGSNHLLEVSSGRTSENAVPHAGQHEGASDTSCMSPGQGRGRPSLGHSTSGQSASMLARMSAANQAAQSNQAGADKPGSSSPFPVAGQQRAAALAAQAAQQAALAIKPSATAPSASAQPAPAQGSGAGAQATSASTAAVLPVAAARPSSSSKTEHSRPRSRSASCNQYPVAGAQRAAAMQASSNMAAYPVAGAQRAAALAAVAEASGKGAPAAASPGLPQPPLSPVVAQLRGNGHLHHSSSLPPVRVGPGGVSQTSIGAVSWGPQRGTASGGLSPAIAGRMSGDTQQAGSNGYAGMLMGALSQCSRDSWSADIGRSSDYMSCVFMGASEGEHGSMRATMRQAMRPLSRGDIEWVYTLTGQTGSHMYMAPEVYLKQPYNEKADVFSFAVVMYELAARSMLVLTHLKGPNGFQTPDHYAAAVARHGYRPQRPQDCSDELWLLISMCWSPDPNQRPSMADVFTALSGLLIEERAREQLAQDAAHQQHPAGPASRLLKNAAQGVGSSSSVAVPGNGVVSTAMVHAEVGPGSKLLAGKGGVAAPSLPESSVSVKTSATKGVEPASKLSVNGGSHEQLAGGQGVGKLHAGEQQPKKAGGLFACFGCGAADEG